MTFSATRRSPTSYVGYIESEGMKRGSAMVLPPSTQRVRSHWVSWSEAITHVLDA